VCDGDVPSGTCPALQEFVLTLGPWWFRIKRTLVPFVRDERQKKKRTLMPFVLSFVATKENKMTTRMDMSKPWKGGG
jgi:hypothetical protein